MTDETVQESIIEFSVNIGEAEAPEPLPSGVYRGTIVEASPATSKTSSKRYAAVRVRISPEEFPADFPPENAPDGVILTYNRVPLEDNKLAHYQMRKWCESIGAPMSNRIDMNEWLHREVSVTVKHELYDGIMRAAVDKIDAI